MMFEEPASARTISRRLEATSILDLCTFIDELDDSAVGEVAFELEGEPRGTVFIERGRICWAAARGLARRLTELLAVPAGLDTLAMERLYADCKRARLPLGEQLVAKGHLTPDELRHALFQHTAESLGRLCSEGARADFRSRAAGGYSARFTFTTAELLVFLIGSSSGSASTELSRAMAEVFTLDEWGAAFVRTGRRSVPDPVAIFGCHPSTATTLLRVGKWAANVVDMAASLGQRDLVLSSGRGDLKMVVWHRGEMIIAGRTGVSGLARMLRRARS